MNDVYKNPKYYEIAFSYRDIAAEVDVLEQAIQQYSHIPVSTVLELGCGPAPHLVELTRRGYRYIGLDLSPAMLTYAQNKADAINISDRFELADMTDFKLTEQVDFAFILLGSLQARNTAELISHFDSVGRVLKTGGLFFLDWCVIFTPSTESVDSWEMVSGQTEVKANFQTTLINPPEQLFEETLTLEVDDAGKRKVFRETTLARQMYPQEFLFFIITRNDFEFVGWWNNWDLTQPLGEIQKISRPIIILRRL
jgi:SAM-dependent methyltransferase